MRLCGNFFFFFFSFATVSLPFCPLCHLMRAVADLREKENIIRNRDASHDGEFVGWWVVHKFRSANGNGQVSFTHRGFLLNKDMSSDILSHSLEDNDNGNMNKINNVIEAILEEECKRINN